MVINMGKYTIKHCRGFWLPDDLIAPRIRFAWVNIALESWDEEEDAEDESIFFYMDGKPLEEGLIISDGFVIVDIEGDDDA
jgi:hypothetical protein